MRQTRIIDNGLTHPHRADIYPACCILPNRTPAIYDIIKSRTLLGLSSSARITVGQANRGTRHFRSVGASAKHSRGRLSHMPGGGKKRP